MFDLPEDLIDSPALSPPPGVTPVFSQTSPDQKWYFICVPLFTVIPGLFMILRFYTKSKIVRKVDHIDWIVLLSFLIFIVNLSIARLVIYYGAGVHQWNLRLGTYMRFLFWLNISKSLYPPTIFLVKTAIILQYLQTFTPRRTGDKFMYYGGWGIIFTMVLFYVPNMMITLFICNPREKIWNPYFRGGTCMNYDAAVLASVSFSILSDLFILLLPVRSIYKLRIKNSKKVAIIALFATGLLATLASSMRLLYMFKLERQGTHQDFSYEMTWMSLWAWAEIALGIIASCTFCLPKLMRANSKELNFFFASIAWPFTAFKFMLSITVDKMRSNETGRGKSSIEVETSSGKAPKTREYVHAPPGLTLDSHQRSFVMENSNNEV